MKTIYDFLVESALNMPDKIAFTFLSAQSEPVEWSYAHLLEKVLNVADVLSERQLCGKKLLLLYADSSDFICSFLACQKIGAIAIPMFPPRGSSHSERLTRIIDDCRPSAILTSENYFNRIGRIINDIPSLAVHVINPLKETATCKNMADRNGIKQSISFIQYTSGSTGSPKGVVITHDNNLHNQQLIKQTFGCDEHSVIGCWLPFYHDMGLIGNILHSLYVGATCVLISPFTFFQRPASWLEMIGTYKVTHSGGPNFAFDLCVDVMKDADLSSIDLSSWKVAYNGSEPVKLETMERFSDFFKSSGFSKESFYPCYGLAEATLLVSGEKNDSRQKIVNADPESLRKGNSVRLITSGGKRMGSSGAIAEGMIVKIRNAENEACEELQIGEICISGKSVFGGYLSTVNNSFHKEQGITYFQTGDLGFVYQNHLFVTGRLKEMIIIRGKNYYPYDIELHTSRAHEAIDGNGIAAVSVEINGYSNLVILAEVKRKYLRMDDEQKIKILSSIESNVIHEIGIKPYDIVLLNPLSIPKTSSGKIKRLKCAELYSSQELEKLFSFKETEYVKQTADTRLLIEMMKEELTRESIIRYLEQVIASKLTEFQVDWTDETLELSSMGIDSLKAMEIINTINKDLRINLDASKIYQNNTFSGLLTMMETTLWLNSSPKGEEIIL